MPSFRPSPQAMLVAGGLTMVLLVAAASGAVAGKLITSRDIQDHTIKSRDLKTNSVKNRNIAPGAVDWDKSLSDGAKKQIESFLSAGPQGPAGEAGPTGPQGSQGSEGPRGPRGDAGSGELVAWDYFINAASEDPSDSPSPSGSPSPDPIPLQPLSGDTVELTEPGNYLVLLRGLSIGAPMFLTLGEPTDELGFLLNGCWTGDVAPEDDFPFQTCDVSYPLTVEPGEPLTLPAYDLFAEDCGCSDDESVFARVAIYKMSSAAVPPPVYGPSYRRDAHREAKTLRRELRAGQN